MSEEFLNIEYEIDERRNGFVFRFPANDEAALWRGPYSTRHEADKAAIKAVAEHLADSVKKSLGLN